MWLAAAAGLATVLGAAGGFLAGRATSEAAPAISATAPVASPAPPVSAKVQSMAERAETGDQEAVAWLEQKPAEARSVAESLALARYAAMRRRTELRELGERIAKDPTVLNDEAVRKSLRAAADDAETARDALRIMASISGSLSADLLYDVWTGTFQRTAATQLAEELVYSQEVRPKASPAMSVALDLRRASTCDERAAILPRAKKHGDRRALPPLAKLVRRSGCGEGKRQDCYPCLRGSEALKEALAAVNERAAPEL